MRRFNLADPDFFYDREDPDGYRMGIVRLGPEAGAVRTGTSLYELPPGQSVCPYHFEADEEEWLLVLAGRPTLRTPDGESALEPWDAVFFPPGPDGAHKVTNATEETVRIMMWSERRSTGVTVYPDSDKLGVEVNGVGEASGLFGRAARLEYFDGEV